MSLGFPPRSETNQDIQARMGFVALISCAVKNRDYINQKDSRPTVGRFIGRSSADLSADKMPDFSSFFIGRQKINYNYLVIIFFPSADSFGVLAIGR